MENIKFYEIKKEIRILGIDDASFNLYEDKKTILIGAIFRGGEWLDGVLKTEVTIDGNDATEKIAGMVKNTRHKDLRVIMLDGITFGGFNVANIKKIYEETGLGVIVVVRKLPDFEEIEKVIKRYDYYEERKEGIRAAGIPRKVETRPGNFIYIQCKGIKFEDAEYIVKLSSTRSLIPEPIRVAHLIASGVALGESRGGA
ncbi:hypothetical protein BEH94_10125 [Candidatus Altiarchaeales archaeon WOR_SM1_SCG]|nr:hypothetical protein BEH94_10125 [Candidatus Altiarchaeales archaeon WOR_SM1_SCG]